MKSKVSSTTLTLIIGLAIIVVVNYIVGSLGFLDGRADLTEKKIYTLSKGTKNIISRINPDEPVTLRFYATEDSKLMPQAAHIYAATVRDLLLEIEKESRGRVKLEKLDPRPSSAEEDKAIADDIMGIPAGGEDQKFYLGLAIEAVDRKEIIPLLNPNEEASLEYSIARALAKITVPDKSRPLIGVMSAMPIAGPMMNFPGMPQRQPPPWMVVQHLRQDYDVREVPVTADSIDTDVKILLVIHPAGISEKTQFAIDQFLLKGGKVIAFVDPNCLVTQAYNNPQQAQMGMPPSFTPPASDMPKLFAAWGVAYDPANIVADMKNRIEVARGRAVPTFLSVGREGINRTEPLTASLEAIQMFSSGAFDITAKDGLTVTRLVESSENSQFIDNADAEKAQNGTLPNFAPDGKKKVLALRLTGSFQTAFPDGPPKEAPPSAEKPMKLPGDTGGEDKDAGAPAAAAATPKKEPAPESLKKSVNSEGMVFLFADADMEYDMFALQRDPATGRPMPVPANSNIPLLLNAVEMAGGGADLVEVRSRGAVRREFTKMKELTDAVDAKYRKVEQEQEAEMTQIVQEIAKLGGAKAEQGFVVLNPNKEQKQQLLSKQLEMQQRKRETEREKNRDKDRLQMKITLLNMAAVPAIVVVLGLVLAVRRRTLQAAH